MILFLILAASGYRLEDMENECFELAYTRSQGPIKELPMVMKNSPDFTLKELRLKLLYDGFHRCLGKITDKDVEILSEGSSDVHRKYMYLLNEDLSKYKTKEDVSVPEEFLLKKDLLIGRIQALHMKKDL